MKLSTIGIRTGSTRDVMRQAEHRSAEDDKHNFELALDYLDEIEGVVMHLTTDNARLGVRLAVAREFASAWKRLARKYNAALTAFEARELKREGDPST
jgi:hypothetical protein